MHTITLNIQDNIYSNIMFLLRNLNLKGLEIKEEKHTLVSQDTRQNIKQLFKEKKVKVFSSINEPLEWQNQQREDW